MIEVRVIKQDIDRGDIASLSECPIALAVKRTLHPIGVRVIPNTISLDTKNGHEYFACSDEVANWIDRFDSSLEVNPITIVFDSLKKAVYKK